MNVKMVFLRCFWGTLTFFKGTERALGFWPVFALLTRNVTIGNPSLQKAGIPFLVSWTVP